MCLSADSHDDTHSGFPSVGKSSLMSGLTGTESVAAAYEFSAFSELSHRSHGIR